MPAKIEVRCNALQMMGRGRASEASETHCSACLFRDCMFSNTPFIILSTNWVKMGVISEGSSVHTHLLFARE